MGEALRKADIREGWRKVVARSSLVPQQSSILRDKTATGDWSVEQNCVTLSIVPCDTRDDVQLCGLRQGEPAYPNVRRC